MAAPEQEEDRETTVETVDEEELYGPSEELLENISAALAEGDIPQVETLIEDLHPADVADHQVAGRRALGSGHLV